ncbi:MAG: RecQ family ATP-dependent DNA helicase [Muribaculaceae bacterium]|nr:RecQ family ATP-dependent DNA helicase [Muribaculaceae bacterium]
MTTGMPETILRKHWGYSEFRPLQREIIDSVLAGNDTLGLLPTGGGKSLTFQVPALILPHLTLVVTPLISLMKDQVDNLTAHGIRAAAIHSGLSRREHNLALDRAALGKIKLLYLSPEKLQSKSFIDRLRTMQLSLITVDEAHCISQWGYDFRPSYLRISALRHMFPHVPVLALTASATPEVAADIMGQLCFKSPNIFTKSFARNNISYIVRHTDDKTGMLLRVLSGTRGSAIVYVRSRKRTRETAQELARHGISADFYHAGLSAEEKNQKQELWKSGQVRVMVATNAFGMGIDKPDVRVVAHTDLPSSLEEYYQEAGRAGRDGLPSYAVVIASRYDKATLTRRIKESFPDKDFIRRVYELAGNFLDVAVGSGYNMVYEFNFTLFCDRFGLQPVPTRNALLLLTRAGYIEYVDEIATRSRVMVVMQRQEMYSLELDDTTDAVLQLLLRSYTGLFADYVYISEGRIARMLDITEERVYHSLLKLGRLHVLHYVPRKSTPYIYYTTSRELPKHVVLPRMVYEEMRTRMERRIDVMKQFVFGTDMCRVKGMLRYFGEKDAPACGMCDVCRSSRTHTPTHTDHAHLHSGILYLASQPGGHTPEYIARQLGLKKSAVISAIRLLMDSGEVFLTPEGRITARHN